MNSLQRPDSDVMADYTGALRRRWWVVLVFTVIGVVGAYAYTVVAPKSYTATTAVYVSPTGADAGNQVAGARNTGAVDLDTEAQIVTSSAVATIAGKTLHSSLTPYALSQQVSVTVPPNSEVLDIACRASTPAGAVACAQAFATAYLQNRSATSSAAVNQQLNSLRGQVTKLQRSIAGLNTKISGLPSNSPQRISAQAQLSGDQSQLRSLTTSVANLQKAGAQSSGGRIITVASPPGKPSSPKKSIVIPSGLVAGLLLGLIAAFVWDRRDKHIHRAADVERLFDLPVLMSLPRGTFSQQVSLVSPRSRAGQAFTELAHALTAALGEGHHVVLVASPSPGPAGSATAANLAATLARAYSDVVLVCADVDSSVAPEMFGLGNGPGLAEVLEGSATVRDVARGPAGLDGLWVITPGAGASSPSYYVQRDTARALTSQLRMDAEFVIIEARGTQDAADTFAFGEFADAALIAVEVPRTDRDEVTQCVQRLRRLRTPVAGAAVLPTLGSHVKVRQAHADIPSRPGQAALDGAMAGHGHNEESTTPAIRAGSSDRDPRSARPSGRYGSPADRMPGS